ncbi:gamma-glutamyltranspeptidase [Hesseltinella vesiculosa]|uniref:Gamma-glutamyltranspeptidase n=1 Tax=Hesseltinella vesiculosa TaxID=101127 RepID=A0A1X2GSF0_9FUNG|nr:gamma-glutamyltranspeptidase [Hesseltinella vesiculosa]
MLALKQGGNAVDAAIASALCVGVIDAFSTGIGGGGFMLIRTPNGTYDFIDFREQAPEMAHPKMFVGNEIAAQIGGLAIATPGELAGFDNAHQKYGKLPWSTLFEPAIKLARDGFEVTRLLETRLIESAEWLLESPEFADIYAPKGELAKQGDVLRRPALARTLDTLAKHGASAFYTGPLAEAMTQSIEANGGILTMSDFKNYSVLTRPTVETYYHGNKVTTTSAPTAGPIVLAMLNILERFNLSKDGRSPLNAHRLIEALKYGFAIRSEMGDPDFIAIDDRMQEIASKSFAAQVRQNLSDSRTFGPIHYGPKYDTIDSHGTMHLSVVDHSDMAVSLTSSVNLMFGARVMDPHTGVIFNCQMDDFSIYHTPNKFGLYPSPSNYPEPWKRPASSITPIMVESDGHLQLVLGGSGGTMIVSSTLNVLLNVLDFDMQLYDAVALPRVHHQLLPNMLAVEDNRDLELLSFLKDRGHEIFELPAKYKVSAVQIIQRMPHGKLVAVSDPRKFGMPSAY